MGIQELSVNNLQQTIAAKKRSGEFILQLTSLQI